MACISHYNYCETFLSGGYIYNVIYFLAINHLKVGYYASNICACAQTVTGMTKQAILRLVIKLGMETGNKMERSQY